MHSCLYEGRVRHRRMAPRPHDFSYRVFYVFLDLDELDQVFEGRWFWSTRRAALARFRRADHFGPHEQSLKQSVLDAVQQACGRRPDGPVRLLTHLRYFGYVFNPVSFFYCYDRQDSRVQYVVVEVNNTPWGERHLYVLPYEEKGAGSDQACLHLDKAFHVSPFMPMDIQYRWLFKAPGERLAVHMENYRQETKLFDATLGLERRPIDGRNCARALLRYPAMTLQVLVGIYWQAFKLWRKGIRFYPHPSHTSKSDKSQGGAETAKSP